MDSRCGNYGTSTESYEIRYPAHITKSTNLTYILLNEGVHGGRTNLLTMTYFTRSNYLFKCHRFFFNVTLCENQCLSTVPNLTDKVLYTCELANNYW